VKNPLEAVLIELMYTNRAQFLRDVELHLCLIVNNLSRTISVHVQINLPPAFFDKLVGLNRINGKREYAFFVQLFAFIVPTLEIVEFYGSRLKNYSEFPRFRETK